ncbi:hypothetical protein B0H13DRAFT_1920753 [Mycena leptocephala]|nr:hypothetical protein B0H13DRAFT_1920753 [Mycena leptocephala]
MAAAIFLARITSLWRVGPSTTRRTTAHNDTFRLPHDPDGDIDLQHEIRLNKLEGPVGVGCRPERASVRHVYSARIDSKECTHDGGHVPGPGAEEPSEYCSDVWSSKFRWGARHLCSTVGLRDYFSSAFQTTLTSVNPGGKRLHSPQGRNSQCERMDAPVPYIGIGSQNIAIVCTGDCRIESDENTAVVNLESTKMLQRPFNGNVRQIGLLVKTES